MEPDVLHSLIQKLKTAATEQERERFAVDLETAIRLSCEPEMRWEAPTIFRYNGHAYRAYQIPD